MTMGSVKTGLAILCAAALMQGCGDDSHMAMDAGEDHVHTDDVATDGGADAAVDGASDATSDGASDATATGTAVEIRFEAAVGTAPFSCTTTFPQMGTSRATWTPLDFRFYVHDVELVPATGAPVPVTLDQDGTWQYRNVALLDFENAAGTCSNGTTATNAVLRGRVDAPAGTRFTGLRFKLGVPQALNHQNPAASPSPLNLSTLFWAWQSGYKFARIDGRAGTNAVNIHIGSTGCTGDAMAGTVTCSEPNRAQYALTGFDPTTNVVVADLAALLGTTDVSRDQGGAPGCMSGLTDPECATILPAFGIPVGGAPATQTFFRVR